MLTELQDQAGQAISSDQLAERIGNCRRQQTAVPLERAIQHNKGDLFVTPGLIKSAKQELVDFLNSQLPTCADYRDRLQRRLKRSAVQPGVHLKAETLVQAPADQASDPLSPVHNQQETAMLDNSKKAKSANTAKKKTKKKRQNASSHPAPLTHIRPRSDNAASAVASAKANSQTHDCVLPMGEVASDRIDSLKALSKGQIRALMAECQTALEQKHQEDIVFLLNEMQTRDIDLRELEAALAA